MANTPYIACLGYLLGFAGFSMPMESVNQKIKIFPPNGGVKRWSMLVQSYKKKSLYTHPSIVTNFLRIRFTLWTSIWTTTLREVKLTVHFQLLFFQEFHGSGRNVPKCHLYPVGLWTTGLKKNICRQNWKESWFSRPPYWPPMAQWFSGPPYWPPMAQWFSEPPCSGGGSKIGKHVAFNDPPLMVATFLPHLRSMGWTMFHYMMGGRVETYGNFHYKVPNMPSLKKIYIWWQMSINWPTFPPIIPSLPCGTGGQVSFYPEKHNGRPKEMSLLWTSCPMFRIEHVKKRNQHVQKISTQKLLVVAPHRSFRESTRVGIDQLQLGDKNSWELRNGTSQWQQNSSVIPRCSMGLEYLLALTVNVGKYRIHLGQFGIWGASKSVRYWIYPRIQDARGEWRLPKM